MSDLRPFKSVETCFMTKRMFSPGECSMVVCREYLSVCCWVKGSMSISYIMQVVITFVFYILTDSLSVTKKTLRSPALFVSLIFLFNFASFCFVYSEAQLLSTFSFLIVISSCCIDLCIIVKTSIFISTNIFCFKAYIL